MRCYLTGEECSCGNSSLDDQCPHDENDLSEDFDPFAGDEQSDIEEALGIERNFLEMFEQLDGGRDAR